MLYQSHYQSPLGDIVLLSDEEALMGLWFADQKYYGAGFDLADVTVGQSAPIKQAMVWLTAYFAGEQPDIGELKLAPQVTAFRQSVLAALATIPYGRSLTYKQVAQLITDDDAKAAQLARAVGGAVGHNPISIIIPCHRVVATDGALTGYAGGMDRKIALLALEGFDRSHLEQQHI
ncbi:methylated-DNA--[protein]-cysteine S-methyltransferase [Furfurilactobacillus entadae]|uniref:methylated-DNA--[protein]-cysteine S-methyltransferase n=1 Tax=Furfurilactobacillus entadae TaxID=2922307 RepID=UPI0035EE0D38